MNLSSDIAKAKAAVSSLEAKAIADAKSVGTLINERLKDRRLWAGLLGIILLIVIALVPTKVELAILDRILGLIALLIVCWTAHGMLRDFVNGWVAVSRNMGLSSEGKLDPADGRPATVAASAAPAPGAGAAAGGAAPGGDPAGAAST